MPTAYILFFFSLCFEFAFFNFEFDFLFSLHFCQAFPIRLLFQQAAPQPIQTSTGTPALNHLAITNQM
jgi:hypothetical protein